MKHKIQFGPVLLLVLGLPLAAGEAEQSKDPGFISGFVNDYTLAVARADLTSIDFDALDKWATMVADQPSIPPERRDEMGRALRQGIAAARSWTSEFRKAGGKELWFVFSIESWPRNAPAFVVVPLGPGADAAALEQLFTPAAPAGHADEQRAAVLRMHNALVVSTDRHGADWIKDLQPSPRPQLTKALAAAGAASFQIAVNPSDDARRVIESMAPQISGGRPAPLMSLAHHLLTAAITAKPPPGQSMDIQIECATDSGAQDLLHAFQSLINGVDKPTPGDRAQEALVNITADLVRQAKVDANRVTVRLDSGQTTVLAVNVASALIVAREHALGLVSASHIRQLVIGCEMYANNHKGQFPDTLQQALEAAGAGADLLVDPRLPQRGPGYVYLKPREAAPKIDRASERMIVYENFDRFDRGIDVGFVDGHVEFISDEAVFRRYLDAARHPDQQEVK